LAKPLASHRFRIAFRIRTAFSTLFFAFSHFLLHVSQLVHQKVVKSAKKCEKNAKNVRKMQKQSAKICEKVRNAMRKQNQNSHRIALLHKKNWHFRTFSHRIRIARPSLMLVDDEPWPRGERFML
jgi:hypothetical protein